MERWEEVETGPAQYNSIKKLNFKTAYYNSSTINQTQLDETYMQVEYFRHT